MILALIFGKSQKTITENKIEKRPVSIFCLLGVVGMGGGWVGFFNVSLEVERIC